MAPLPGQAPSWPSHKSAPSSPAPSSLPRPWTLQQLAEPGYSAGGQQLPVSYAFSALPAPGLHHHLSSAAPRSAGIRFS